MIETQHKKILKKALKIRLVEEKLLSLFQEGKINGTVHTCIGQELTGVCLAEVLNSDDIVLSNHRGHGHFLARNENLEGFFAELMGRKNGICGGIGGSQHFYTPNHISNGIQGGMTPIGAGLAFANKINNNRKVVVCFIGDGTLGEGVIYEAFNIASLWNLPIIYVLENNKIAQSTPIEQTFSGDVALRAKGFGLQYLKSSTWDIDHLLHTFEEAVSSAREKQKAVFVEVDTFRLYSHSKGDDNRDQQIIDDHKKKDLVSVFNNKKDIEIITYIETVQSEINKAVAYAEQSPILEYLNEIIPEKKTIKFTPYAYKSKDKRINELIRDSLRSQFENTKETIFIGEDIQSQTEWTKKPYGGAFKVSKDLSSQFEYIKNTPISEAGIVGVGTGLAIGNMKPIVEIMFGDFLTLAFDQLINHACKFHRMFNGQLNIPLVIRTPMGGKRGYGPTHSQSIEKHFLGIPDLTVVALNHRIPPEQLYNAVFKENNPVLVIENKVLYTKTIESKAPLGFELLISNEVYPTLKISPKKNKPVVTILCYGEILEEVEQAVATSFYEEEIVCEVICPTVISPIDVSAVLTSVKQTGRLVIVEEGSNIAAFGAEIVALITENKVLLKSMKRLANNNIIPSSLNAELKQIPTSDRIFESIKSAYESN